MGITGRSARPARSMAISRVSSPSRRTITGVSVIRLPSRFFSAWATSRVEATSSRTRAGSYCSSEWMTAGISIGLASTPNSKARARISSTSSRRPPIRPTRGPMVPYLSSPVEPTSTPSSSIFG